MGRKKKKIIFLKLFLEIFVVFLGVTAGFILNNWRENEKDKKLEQKYINAFHTDVDHNINELKEAVQRDSLWITRAQPLLILIHDKKISIDSARSAVQLISTITQIDLYEGTYQDLISSGNLNLLSNFALKEKIVDYNLLLEGVKLTEGYFKDFFMDFVLPFLASEVNLFGSNFKDKRIIKSFRFSNTFALYYGLLQQRKAVYEELLTESYLLKKELETHLKKR